ncbi:MAG: DUF4065 domain-containing protein, partial [Bacteroidota bacterium]|nr:DUF4065 domain-containing protein [Bacteroidota bacterium]
MTQAITASKYFMLFSSVDQRGISHLMLQKLLYIAQGFHLVIHNIALFPDEIQAWRYGPVVPNIFKLFKTYGPVSIPADDIVWQIYDNNTISRIEINSILVVWETFKNFTALQLSNWTHKIGSPWKQTFKEDKNVVISLEKIRAYFVE